jgi:2-oxoisovalerate dehydrogenase E1 component
MVMGQRQAAQQRAAAKAGLMERLAGLAIPINKAVRGQDQKAGGTVFRTKEGTAVQVGTENGRTIATIGDAAARQGEFYEAWAFAVQEKLPVIFILEDNKYGISTPTEKFMPFHLPLFDSEAIVKVDGRRPDDILEAGRTAINKARSGDGPTMIWLDLDRLSSHTSSDDHRVYRDLNEIEEMQHRDPIRLLSEELLKSGALTEAAFQAMQDEVFKLVDEDYIAAEKADDPIGEETMRDCWGDEVTAEAPPIAPGRQTMVSAINTTFRKALENDPKVVFFGEDIEDPKGGVFRLTAGLSSEFHDRVFNAPLAEATIAGVAIGMQLHRLPRSDRRR